MHPVTLRTDRLVLSAPGPADVEAVVAYANDPDVIAFTPVPVPYGHAEAHRFLEQVDAGWRDDTRYDFGIRRAGDPRLLGTVGVFGFVDGACEIGYALHPHGRGQGLVTEAAARVLEWAFAAPPTGLGLVRVQWRALGTNAASVATARRIGMRFEGRSRSAVVHRGVRRDQLLAAVLRDDDRSTPTDWPTP
ncbi:hypothetical protein NS263_09780 [Curtobacterium oceanosedimentum]|uniref:N-acetyltransferase domain-containing protein n=1 Tax=Curtobacterium oceanosedimentum TaxID=465820 RepID=A0ABR5S5P8_9MICO|nr:GNAT family protein [Curtobacterium oceanosedimentum]KTR39687.1 hypothetical protein NS263_09780 [Curtobacterium oceanosedimentum]